MELYRRDFLISRIKAGYIPINIDDKRLLVHHPTNHILVHANEIYIEAYNKALEEELLDDEDMCNILILNDLWSEQKEKELETIVPGHIEYWKKELYNSILKSNTRDTIRKYLAVAKTEYNHLYQVRHSLDHMTCAGYASYVKNMFMIANSTRYKHKKINWKTLDLNAVMNAYHAQMLDADTIRMLSRTYPWSSMWPTLKTNGHIFTTSNLTIEQQTLISWSTMYDKIYESPDCPSEEVVDDDDMLDGWLLIQKEKRETDKKKNEVESTLGKKLGNADDVFLMAETQADAQKINLLNTQHMSKIKQQRLHEIKEHGHLQEQQLTDVKMKRSMQLRQAYVNQVKGR